MPTKGRGTTRNGTKPEDLLDSLMATGEDLVEGVDRAIEQSMAMAKYRTPSAAELEVRREGLIFRHDNPEDRKRYEAFRANRARGILTADHMTILGGFAVNGQQYVLEVVSHLIQNNYNLPDEVQPVGEALTRKTAKVLAGAFGESLEFLAEQGFKEINEATKPGQHQQ